ncbi:nucleotidyltransferase family protein [Candidatus Uhrbacteria bacterium]|nr:nucleotidyltransferase family protein [Candidatus Uhrbacteria bacterium]
MYLTITTIKKKAVPILKKAGARRSALFGSTVRGTAKRSSDIDMLVDIPRSVGLLDFIGLQQELASALGRRVDLVEYHMLKPRIRDRILKESIPLYAERSPHLR